MSTTLERLWRRVLFVVGRGRITLVSDGGPVQLVQAQLLADELREDTPRLAEYGFQSNPPPGSDAVLLFLAGERTNGLVIACGSQTYRMRGLASGEVSISDDKGQSVWLSATGIRINGGGLPINVSNTSQVVITSPSVHMTGNLLVDGTITGAEVHDQAGGKSMSGMRTTFNSHKNGTASLSTPPM